MTKKAVTHLIIDTLSSTGDYNGDCDYALVELTPPYLANILHYMKRVAQMRRADDSVYCLELWDYSPSYFSYNEQFEALRDLHRNKAVEVPRGEPILLNAAPGFREDCFQRVDCQTVQITADEALWSCYVRDTTIRIESASVSKTTLLEIRCRLGIQEDKRPMGQPPTIHPAIRRVHDLLRLDMRDGREFYNPDRAWDADTISAIAEVIAEQMPRPKQSA